MSDRRDQHPPLIESILFIKTHNCFFLHTPGVYSCDPGFEFNVTGNTTRECQTDGSTLNTNKQLTESISENT